MSDLPICGKCNNAMARVNGEAFCLVCSDGDTEGEPAPAEVSTLATMHECPSCHAFIFNAKRFEGHEDACMQPEIRMRRLEARVAKLEEQRANDIWRNAPMDGR